MQKELDQLAGEKAELQDRILRAQAEFQNFKKRVERERSEMFEYATMEAVRALLPVLDDFERALKAESSDKEYAKGMELIYQRFYDALKKLGLEPIVSAGEPFDPHIHHAVEMVETEDAPSPYGAGRISARLQFQGPAAAAGDGESSGSSRRRNESVTKRDYYEILGVERECDDGDP